MSNLASRCAKPKPLLGRLRRTLVCAFAWCAGAATPVAFAATPPVGVKLMLQPWNPLTNDDAVKTVYDSPDALTTSLTRAWAALKPKLISNINARLQTPNLFAQGVTLYGVTINISDPELSIVPDGTAGFIAKLVVRETTLDAKSTTPDIALGIGFGSYADPRCSLRFALDLNLRLAVTDDKARLLQPRYAAGDQPVLVHGFKAEAQNATCALGKFLASDVAKLFTGRDMWQWLTDEVNNPARPEFKALNDSIKSELSNALVAVNAQLKGPADLARLRVWVRNDKLVVLLGVRELPLPARVASVRGHLALGDLRGLPMAITRCDQLQLTAQVKTGPAPVLDASGTQFGPAPMVAVGSLHGTSMGAAGQGCDYTVDQLVPGFPQLLRFSYANPPHSVARASRNPQLEYVLKLRARGWHFDQAVHPQPQISGLDLTLQAENAAASAVLDQAKILPNINRGDPAPWHSTTTATTTATKTLPGRNASLENRAIIIVGGQPAQAAELDRAQPANVENARAANRWSTTANRGDAAALNPQPLPPDPQPDPMPQGKAARVVKAPSVLAPRQ